MSKSLPSWFPLAALVLLAEGCTNAAFRPVEDASPPGPSDTADAPVPPAGDDAPDATTPDLPVCPEKPVLACVSSGSTPCDPVCQTGTCNWCTNKCTSVYSRDDGTVLPACRGFGTNKVGEACQPSLEGTVNQFDDCAAGAACLRAGGAPTGFCFAMCHDKSNCIGNVECAARPLSAVGGSVMVCDPEYHQCGPDGDCCNPLANTGCPSGGVCFLVTPDPGTNHSRTVCEYASGNGHNGAPCNTARDCLTQNTCVGGGCQQVCNDSAPCLTGTRCISFGSEFGYCS